MKLHKLKSLAYVAGLSLAITGFAQAADESVVSLDSEEQIASYGIGYGFAANLMEQTAGIELSAEALLQGVSDAMESIDMAVTEEAIQAAISALQAKQMASQAAESEALSSVARAEGEAFLAENGQRDGVMTTESGLQYEVIEASDSDVRPTAENTVQVHYHGTLVNGSVFDSSVERGEPVEFPLNQVIAGWTEGVQLMAKGEKYRFFIPAALAYGDSQASPQIPPGSTLIFEVELLDII
ncbi:FKBP-type peptidyl-prolyl cis-trans isomerase [Reinekea sp.]|jgi:FKBP-type peptidyl-prolyl cis-trans isomerase|uniref:FKBP-type peptidyl-prolyl cis-trans isomerase n=1 Tax=Reinekea sp. TaxID=1970455 RepID=UPI002A80845A|nr:FKBP-type peptidyl-prolyl cis-trans isomerase [Reinekea sp.]